MLFHCIYTSVETHPLPEPELIALISHSREKNLEHGLTGVLLHVGNTFFQVLEGPAEVIDCLYDQILQDPRHCNITRIIYEPVARRFFSDSNMSLVTLSPAELAQLLNSGDAEQRESLLSDLDEGRSKRLLRAFADGRWRANAMQPPPASATARALLT